MAAILPDNFPVLRIASRTIIPVPPRRVRVVGRPAEAGEADGTGLLPVLALHHLPGPEQDPITPSCWRERVDAGRHFTWHAAENWVNRIATLLALGRDDLFEITRPTRGSREEHRIRLCTPLRRETGGDAPDPSGFEVQVSLRGAPEVRHALWVDERETAGDLAARVRQRWGYDKVVTVGPLYTAVAQVVLYQGEAPLLPERGLVGQGVRSGDVLGATITFETSPSVGGRPRRDGEDPAEELVQELLREARVRLLTPGWVGD